MVTQPYIGPVYSVVISPDDSKLATSVRDKVILWDVANRSEIQTLTHEGVDPIAFTPDGSQLASGSDGKIFLWDVDTGKLIRQFLLSNPVRSLEFSPDGKLLASATHKRSGQAPSDAGNVILWDVSTGLELRRFGSKVGRDVAFSSDGSILATINYNFFNDIITLYNVSTGIVIQHLQPANGDVRMIDFSPDGALLASGSARCSILSCSHHVIHIWNLSTGKSLTQFDGRKPNFSPDGTFHVQNARDNSIWTGTFKGQTDSGIINPDLDIIFSDVLLWLNNASLAYSSDGTYWVAGGASILIHYVDSVQSFTLPNSPPTSGIQRLVFSPNGTMIASGNNFTARGTFSYPCKGVAVGIWDALTGETIQSFSGARDCVLNFSPDGTQIATVDTDGRVSLRDVTSGKTSRYLNPSLTDPTSVTISPDWKLLAYGYANGAITFQLVETGQQLSNLPFIGHSSGIRAMLFSKDGRKLVTADTESDLIVWDVDSGVSLKQCNNLALDRRNPEIYISPDASHAIVGKEMFDLQTCSRINLPEYFGAYVASYSFTPDGTHVILGVDSGGPPGLSIMDLNNNEITHFIRSSKLDDINSISISEDGNFIGVADRESIRLWDWSDRKPVGFEFQISDQNYPRGQPITPLRLPLAQFPPPYTDRFYLLGGGLPDGLTFRSSRRIIEGTPINVTSSPVNMIYSSTTSSSAFSRLSLDFTISVYSPVSVSDEEFPSTFEMVGNYPNPFRQVTNLTFNLPWSANISADIMDITGRHVLALPQRTFSAGWSQSMEINGESLPPGLYLYRLTVDSPSGILNRMGRFVRIR